MTDMIPSEASLLQPGQIFAGKYRVKRYLAKGAMGAVFVGEHINTELIVAIKVLFVENNPKQNSVQALTEAKVAGRVKSENIVQVQDAGVDPESNLTYLVMELLEGKTLEELVESNGPLSPQEVVLYLRQVASGLDKAHNYKTAEGPQPIVHRDLKPENLFLAHRDDGSPLIKILDFGIAKVLSGKATKATQQMKGTPLYMAPEQLTLDGVSPATDIWALGLIAFFLLTGQSYWRSASDENASVYSLFAEIGAPKISPSERARELRIHAPWTSDFDAWFLKMLAVNPQERFSSASSAIDALAAVLGVELGPRFSFVDSPSVSSYSTNLPVEYTKVVVETKSTQSVSVGSPEEMKSSLLGLSTSSEQKRGNHWWKPAMLVALVVSVGVVILAMKLHEPEVVPVVVQTPSASPPAASSSSSLSQVVPHVELVPAASGTSENVPPSASTPPTNRPTVQANTPPITRPTVQANTPPINQPIVQPNTPPITRPTTQPKTPNGYNPLD